MYKDDNITGGCSDALLRKLLSGEPASCPIAPDKTQIQSGTDNKGNKGWGISGYPLASVYAPLQSFDNIYDLNTALKQGTVFAELDLPFMGNKRVGKGGNCCG